MSSFDRDKMRLASRDGEIFPVNIDVIRCSGTISTLLEELDLEDYGIVPLPGVIGSVLKKCVEYAEYHRFEPPPKVDEHGFPRDRSTNLCDWDMEFFGGEDQVPLLYDLILASHYLDMKGLCHASCRRAAQIIKGKTPEQIRQVFLIENDLHDENENENENENGKGNGKGKGKAKRKNKKTRKNKKN